ncbi:MAG: arsenite methyltransferase [Balneolaceae bacterium]|nr:arsenite methyltransferase [Balneolaceae bacterium]
MNTKTKTPEELKQAVKEKYAQISRQSREKNTASCCGAGCGCRPGAETESAPETVEYSVFADSYEDLKGYNREADLGLGCGLPTEYARISEGDTVVDLGSGAGNDCFVARSVTGESGLVVGLDMVEEMVEKAHANAEKLGYDNVEFVLGDIEAMPLEDGMADVVVSNCVLNLVPDKRKAFAETFRILRGGGHFSISDVVTRGELPVALQQDAEMYAGCVSGAIDIDEYLGIVRETGFRHLAVQKEKEITLPDEILRNYFGRQELADFRNSGTGIYSITLYAEKPEA